MRRKHWSKGLKSAGAPPNCADFAVWGSFLETDIEEQSLTAEDQLFILMQAALYLTATRGLGAPEARICYERAESLCHSLNRPLLLYSALRGQWICSLVTDKLTATMQIAKRVYSLAKEQSDSALLISANRTLSCTSCFLGEFESTRQYAMRALQLWYSGGARSPVEEVDPPAVACLVGKALSEWHLGEIASSRATMAEAVSLAKELNNMHGVAEALYFAACLGHYERDPAEVERYSSDLIELSTRENFAFWLAAGAILRGWARSASGDKAEGLSWIEEGILDYRATGSTPVFEEMNQHRQQCPPGSENVSSEEGVAPLNPRNINFVQYISK